ncbi:MAG: hypothetical protein ACI3Z0_10950, partial [Candidatus Cryptobacteroides sp.]
MNIDFKYSACRAALCVTAVCLSVLDASAQRSETLLEKGWKFHLGDAVAAQLPEFNDSGWE